MMVIGLDNVEITCMEGKYVELGSHTDKNEKYVYAVDHKVDMVITDSSDTAKYFRDNGISALVKI